VSFFHLIQRENNQSAAKLTITEVLKEDGAHKFLRRREGKKKRASKNSHALALDNQKKKGEQFKGKVLKNAWHGVGIC